MTNTNNTLGGDSSETVEKPIEIDRELWQRVRDEAAASGMTTSKALEEILRSYLENDEF